jgi:hypothetical protein
MALRGISALSVVVYTVFNLGDLQEVLLIYMVEFISFLALFKLNFVSWKDPPAPSPGDLVINYFGNPHYRSEIPYRMSSGI